MDGVKVNQINVMDSLYSITGVSQRTLCCAKIVAVTRCNNMQLTSVPFSICAETLEDIPGLVTNLQAPANVVGINSFALTWDPPQNYMTTPGVSYTINIMDESVGIVTDVPFFHVSNLSSCADYAVTVGAQYGNFSGPLSNISVRTRPPLPPPPERLSFFNNSQETLSLMWNRPSEVGCNYNIQRYRLSWSCTERIRQVEFPSTLTFYTIDISSVNISLGWCVAQLQSCGIDRCGDFSNQAIVSIPQSIPSQPRCFLHAESISRISVSFAVLTPFGTTDNVNIRWILNSTDEVVNGSYHYDITNSNVVDLVDVDSNTEYGFELHICNVHGCSLPCTINFNTSVSYITIP